MPLDVCQLQSRIRMNVTYSSSHSRDFLLLSLMGTGLDLSSASDDGRLWSGDGSRNGDDNRIDAE